MEVINYKDFSGSIEISRDSQGYILHGKILFINDPVTYEANNFEDIEAKFRAAVDDYIITCGQLDSGTVGEVFRRGVT